MQPDTAAQALILNRLLRRFASTTFHDLLSRYRIEKCLELIHNKNYTLTEIYSRCGFNSAATLTGSSKSGWAVYQVTIRSE